MNTDYGSALRLRLPDAWGLSDHENRTGLADRCLERLNRVGIPHMLVGSMASNFWGIPRSTHDLDFVLALRPNDVDPLAQAFSNGFFVQRESIQGAFEPPYQFNAIDERSALKVDFWLLKDDSFERCAFERRQEVVLFGTPAWIATAEDVILHKLHWHRLPPSDRQLLDTAGVYAVQADALDLSYLRRWSQTLGIETELEALLTGKLKPKST
ncbi:MAG: hypothetical protein JSS27_07940 [Planctomycetes bacterium]|nr:hypothetical protein [Planctomycetota bacterium]